jgi:hypothetical protein
MNSKQFELTMPRIKSNSNKTLTHLRLGIVTPSVGWNVPLRYSNIGESVGCLCQRKTDYQTNPWSTLQYSTNHYRGFYEQDGKARGFEPRPSTPSSSLRYFDEDNSAQFCSYFDAHVYTRRQDLSALIPIGRKTEWFFASKNRDIPYSHGKLLSEKEFRVIKRRLSVPSFLPEHPKDLSHELVFSDLLCAAVPTALFLQLCFYILFK